MIQRLRSWSIAIVLMGIMALGAAALASCGGGSSSSSPSSGGNTPGAAAKPTATPAPVATITVGDNGFTPAELRVKAGTTVRWVWTGNNPHSVLIGGLDSGQHTGSGTFEQTFPSSGATIRYQDGVLGAAVTGTIIVE